LDVISAIEDFRSFLDSKYSIINTYRELPLEHQLANHQMMVGSADLLIETPEGYVLIDYKSYPGKVDHLLDEKSSAYAGKYAGQLQAYSDAIESGTGKKVIAKYLLYIVLGVLVEVKNK
jgi:ATP-dependent helicase/nuclease subunit A